MSGRRSAYGDCEQLSDYRRRSNHRINIQRQTAAAGLVVETTQPTRARPLRTLCLQSDLEWVRDIVRNVDVYDKLEHAITSIRLTSTQ